MKKILGLILVSTIINTASAQDAAPNGRIPRWYIGLNAKGGEVSEKISTRYIGQYYKNTIMDIPASDIKIENEFSYGGELQVGFFFDKKAHWGVATGVIYRMHEGTMTIDKLTLQYQATDWKGATFRQVVNSQRPITEQLKTTNIAIPLMVKYRTQISKVVGIMIDAGATYSVAGETDYSADALLRYEAIYKYENRGDGGYVPVYDNAIKPDPSDWLITVEQYQRTKGDGKEAQYFQQLRDEGYSVAIGETVKKSGTVKYKTAAIGILFQPSFTFRLSHNIGLQVGGYYMYQNFNNTDENLSKKVVGEIGTYSSYLNNAIKNKQVSYGANIGINFFL